MSAISQYLHKRPNSQFYQLRRVIPASLRPILKKREFTKSLRVTDRKDAETLSYFYLSEWEMSVREAMDTLIASQLDLSSLSNTELAYKYGFKDLSERIQNRIARYARKESCFGETENPWEHLESRLSSEKRLMNRQISAGDLSRWEPLAKAALKDAGRTLASDELQVFVENIAHMATEALSEKILSFDGQSHTFEPSPLLRAEIKKASDVARTGETFEVLFERYATQRFAEKKKRDDSIQQDRLSVQQFASIVGLQRSVRSISPDDVREWQDIARKLPSNFSKMNVFAGLSIREIAHHPASRSKQKLADVTIQRNFAGISGFFRWCVSQKYCDRNPFDGLGWAIPKGENSRPPFTIEQLNTIFSSPLFTGFQRDKREHVKGNSRANDWRYWIPLICFFTGARIGEIAQLNVGDIEEQHGIPIIQIRYDETQGQSTKSGKSRFVPVSSRLVRCGFLRFVEDQRAKAIILGNNQLFPELEKNQRGQISGKPSRFWRNYLGLIGIKHGNDGYGAHSFRHTLADELRIAEYLDAEIEVALGHNQKTVTSGYGRLSQGTVNRLSIMFEKIEFDGLNIDHLYTL